MQAHGAATKARSRRSRTVCIMPNPRASSSSFDVVIQNGLVFDGTGAPGARVDIGVRDGRVVAVGARLETRGAREVIDATDKWVTPGFIDLHTHYDAEVEALPGLSESVRHGVTTVVVGSCSLSLAVGTPDDLADMFCRVEAIPDRIVRPLLRARKSWSTHAEYLAHLDTLPLGPNVAAFAGHSAIRVHAMGIERAVAKVAPTEEELACMDALVTEALDAGYLGLSVQTLPWDKMGGTRDFRSRPLPSTFARWSEVRRLARHLRERGAIFQGVPNVSTKWNVILFLLESAAGWLPSILARFSSRRAARRALKTTVISMMEPKTDPGIHKIIGALSRFFNTQLGADFRWQALPEVFDLWADGVDLVVFEEFGAGTAALHLEDALARARLLRDPKYRARFRREWTSRFLPRAFHRNFDLATILACPDASVVGKTFTRVGEERGVDAVDAFLDLVAEHGDALRWTTVMCNEKPESVKQIVAHPDVLIGFSDAGAHLRQMAHYSFPLRMLRLANDAGVDARRTGTAPFMTIERAVHRLTGEIGAWLGIDVGTIAVGKRADLCVIHPAHLDASLEEVHEAPMTGFDDSYRRLVRRNDAAVPAVFVGGVRVVAAGAPTAALGRDKTGVVLRKDRAAATAHELAQPAAQAA
jgi:N-acyl-D-aspartate/D-glutamate deacylase